MKIDGIKQNKNIFKISKSGFLLLSVIILGIKVSNGQVDGTDIRVSPSSLDDQFEVHISVNKANPGNLILSASTYVPGPSPWQMARYQSSDYGASWIGTDACIPPQTAGDPSTAFDIAGNAYVVGLGNGFTGYWVEKSTDKGVTWSAPVSPFTTSIDKEMIACDNMPNSLYANNFYCAWTGGGQIFFNRSTDGAVTFSSPISLSNATFGQGTHIQTGRSGEVYVCWADGLFPEHNIGFARSLDGGVTFPLKTNTAIALNGTRGTTFNGVQLNSFPSMGVDKSCGTYKDRIYMTYAENIVNGGGNMSVIKVKYSDDKGSTWTYSNFGQAINITTASQSYFPWIAVDDATGDISIIYYSLDTYPNPGIPDWVTNTYVAHSSDGGNSFSNLKVSDVSHISQFPANGRYDYLGIAAYGGIVYPAWMDSRSGAWQIYVSPINYNTPVVYSSENVININGPATITSNPTSVLYEAVNTINCPVVNTVTISSGAHANMVAGTIVNLQPGFTALSGSNFYAYIGNVNPCTNDINRLGDFNNNPYAVSGSNKELIINAFPNPFQNSIDFEYNLREKSNVNLIIYNSLGVEIFKVINNKIQNDGTYRCTFDASEISSGFYFYVMQTGDNRVTGKMIKN